MPVVVSGTKQAIKSLRKVNPEAAKAVRVKVTAAAKPVVSKARGFAPSEAPLSGWGIARGAWKERVYEPMAVRRGIGFSQSPTKPNRQGFSYTAYIYNKSTAGAIYETAGRKNPNGRPPAPSVQHYADAGTPQARADYMVRNSSKEFSQSANPMAGQQFIDAMGTLYKAQRVQGQGGRVGRKLNGRLIFRAWAEDQGRVLGAVAKAYDEVTARFNRGEI